MKKTIQKVNDLPKVKLLKKDQLVKVKGGIRAQIVVIG